MSETAAAVTPVMTGGVVSVGVVVADCTSANTFNLPYPQSLFGTEPVVMSCVALLSSRLIVSVISSPWFLSYRSAMAPATCGEAMLVPRKTTCVPSLVIYGV